MALVFKTEKDSPHDVEILGAGVAGAYGRGGVPVAEAAQVMTELQEQDDEGRLVLDEQQNPKPLSGSALTAAAKRFADERGLAVENLSDDKIRGLPQERGAPPNRPPLVEVAKAEYERVYGGDALVPTNNDPNELSGLGRGFGNETSAEQPHREEGEKEENA